MIFCNLVDCVIFNWVKKIDKILFYFIIIDYIQFIGVNVDNEFFYQDICSYDVKYLESSIIRAGGGRY